MSLEFLSDEWFAKVKEIRESAGDVEAPAALDRLVLRHCAARGADDETPLARRHRNRSRVVPRLVRAAGFHDVRVHWRGWNVEIQSVDDFFALQATFSSTARKRLGAASVSRREAVRQSFDHLCRRVRERGGRFYYPHAALAITARR